MADLTWLANEAKNIHAIFQSLFYALVIVFLLLGVLIEYFKWPLGAVPSFGPLVGRVLIAAVLLHTYPDVSNLIADVTDGIAQKIGDLNEFKLVLARMGEKFHEFTWSWVSVKESITMALSFVMFFILYFSVYIADAFLVYTWTLLFVFSPVLIALYVLPQTSSATKGLYRSLFEVGCWKIVWSVLATLLWSAALSDINKPGADIHFIAVVCYSLILSGSILLTPLVVHSLAGKGLASMSSTVGAVAVGSAVVSPMKLVKLSKTKMFAKKNAQHSVRKSAIKANSKT